MIVNFVFLIQFKRATVYEEMSTRRVLTPFVKRNEATLSGYGWGVSWSREIS